MKHAITLAACAVASITLSACASDPVALAQAVRLLEEGCQRTVDLSLDKSQPGGGALRMTRTCQPIEAPSSAVDASPKP